MCIKYLSHCLLFETFQTCLYTFAFPSTTITAALHFKDRAAGKHRNGDNIYTTIRSKHVNYRLGACILCWTIVFFSNSSGMMNSGYWKSWCAPISLKLPWSCSRAKQKTFYVINTQVPFSFTDPTNRWKALRPTRHLELFWRRQIFGGLWNSSMEVLVILVRIRTFKSSNSSCLNYYQKNYVLNYLLVN